MQRQRVITAIKNVTEKKKKAQMFNWISQCQQGFPSSSDGKIDNYNRGGQKGEKIFKNPEKSSEQVKK